MSNVTSDGKQNKKPMSHLLIKSSKINMLVFILFKESADLFIQLNYKI